MTIQEWFDKRKEAQIERRAKEMRGIEDANPGLWVKCVHCDSQILKNELEDNLMVCPHCDYHFRINARTRISQLFDEDSFEEFFKGVKPTDYKSDLSLINNFPKNIFTNKYGPVSKKANKCPLLQRNLCLKATFKLIGCSSKNSASS